ncbi:hypothetical protein [Kordiimonas aquimaris]|uniref:hypothetical protein n=1 Tax=Kordiimonas aquimaris TaxID=707591 RepID=UPI0021D0AEE6|nr:hypothetical protein [Kordiimonas aquimaris]
MEDRLLHWLWRNKMIVGLLAVIISIFTWTIELMGMVYVCPFCRTQRTVIGLLGLMMLFPNPGWIVRYVATVIGAFGFAVGATQHFAGWRRIMSGEFEWGEQWYVNSWPLSGFAIFIITGLVLLLWTYRKEA